MNSGPSSIAGTDGVRRCWWCGDDPLYVAYHDQEWGRPVTDDQRLFEKICLEGFQAGLSWLTILRKRDAFREVFFDFDIEQVARMTETDVDRLVLDARLIRHRGKIESTINNAQRALELTKEFGSLSHFFWQFKPAKHPILKRRADALSTTAESTAMGKTLKQRKWSFVGPTTCYAFMQSMGIVNDHVRDCHRFLNQ